MQFLEIGVPAGGVDVLGFSVAAGEHGKDAVGDVVGFLLDVFDLYFLDGVGAVDLAVVVHAELENVALLLLEHGALEVGHALLLI